MNAFLTPFELTEEWERILKNYNLVFQSRRNSMCKDGEHGYQLSGRFGPAEAQLIFCAKCGDVKELKLTSLLTPKSSGLWTAETAKTPKAYVHVKPVVANGKPYRKPSILFLKDNGGNDVATLAYTYHPDQVTEDLHFAISYRNPDEPSNREEGTRVAMDRLINRPQKFTKGACESPRHTILKLLKNGLGTNNQAIRDAAKIIFDQWYRWEPWESYVTDGGER